MLKTRRTALDITPSFRLLYDHDKRSSSLKDFYSLSSQFRPMHEAGWVNCLSVFNVYHCL